MQRTVTYSQAARNFIVHGPGFAQPVVALDYADAIALVAGIRRVNPILLCAQRDPIRLAGSDFTV